ncbi:hypothetical protein BURPSPAST_AA0377 [Burkholderia pseudomallei Pasteur 52237]|nr:hypothetical protein BURPSPAST_AA0377 [Burkholderia pseudomallei Pasteur 52237]
MLVLANRAVGQSYRNHIAISVMPSVIGRLSTRERDNEQ